MAKKKRKKNLKYKNDVKPTPAEQADRPGERAGQGLQTAGSPPAPARETSKTTRLLILVALSLVAYFTAFGARALEYPEWKNNDYAQIGDEYILATHDAFHWVGAAKGVGYDQETLMVKSTEAASKLTGMSLGDWAFWAPAILTGFVAVVTLLWAWTLGAPYFGVMAGMLVTVSPGYFYRTRLGFYDTDLYTLLLPLLTSWAMAHWLSPMVRKWWVPERFTARLKFMFRGGKRPQYDEGFASALVHGLWRPWDFDEKTAGRSLPVVMAGALGVGLLARIGHVWHGDIAQYNRLLFWMTLAVILFSARPMFIPAALWGLLIFGLCALKGFVGIAISAALVAFFIAVKKSPPRNVFRIAPVLLILAVLVLQTNLVAGPVREAMQKVAGYLKPVAQEETIKEGQGAGVVYPGIAQSVREAQNLDISATLQRLWSVKILAVLGLIGMTAVAVVRPTAMFILPLAALSLMANKLGARVNMFGAPGVALGLCVPVGWLLNRLLARYAWRKWAVMAAGVMLGALLLYSPLKEFTEYVEATGPQPVISKPHVVGLTKLKERSPDTGVVWTWWDWGYAAQYYAELMSFADGARHSGEYLFPLARVMTTDNAFEAGQLIKFSASQDGAPWKAWNKMSPREVQDLVEAFGRQKFQFNYDKKQYLVVAWDNLRLFYWISFYGNWDFAAKTGEHNNFQRLNGRIQLSSDGNVHLMDKGRIIPVRGVLKITADSDQLQPLGHFPENPEAYLLINERSGEVFLMDGPSLGSMAVRLLLTPPGTPDLTANFRLVYDDYPWVRIYEVL